jgi:hypothetical protein
MGRRPHFHAESWGVTLDAWNVPAVGCCAPSSRTPSARPCSRGARATPSFAAGASSAQSTRCCSLREAASRESSSIEAARDASRFQPTRSRTSGRAAARSLCRQTQRSVGARCLSRRASCSKCSPRCLHTSCSSARSFGPRSSCWSPIGVRTGETRMRNLRLTDLSHRPEVGVFHPIAIRAEFARSALDGFSGQA